MKELLPVQKAGGPADDPPCADSRSLFKLLGRLLTQIDPSETAGSSTNGSAHRSVDRWEDDAYLYFEAMLPDVLDRDVDICLHNGKVVIRMEK